jgi:hypothetical protein
MMLLILRNGGYGNVMMGDRHGHIVLFYNFTLHSTLKEDLHVSNYCVAQWRDQECKGALRKNICFITLFKTKT